MALQQFLRIFFLLLRFFHCSCANIGVKQKQKHNTHKQINAIQEQPILLAQLADGRGQLSDFDSITISQLPHLENLDMRFGIAS